MPKIDAPTLAEHRARQERALLDGARRLLLDGGPQAVTPAAVGATTGLARNSVYKYFASREHILDRIVTEAFSAWAERVCVAVEAAADPEARIDAYVSTTLAAAAEGAHRVAVLGGGIPQTEAERVRLAQAHQHLAAPLRAALGERGDPQPEMTAELIDGALGRAIEQLDAGRPADQVTATTLGFVRRALGIQPPAATHHQISPGKEQTCTS
ncbi:MAG: TetR/AcrR family transcriptional regulator [Actinomycetia bacterium]|nr:TetR/AcrR family transcriptional regulator [Actinomycetes bacterium]